MSPLSCGWGFARGPQVWGVWGRCWVRGGGEPRIAGSDKPGAEWTSSTGGRPGYPLPQSSSGEPCRPEHRGRLRQPRLVTGTMSHRGRARCLPTAGAGRGQRRGAGGAGGGGGVRGKREVGAGQAPPRPAERVCQLIPLSPLAGGGASRRAGSHPPAARGGDVLAPRRRCRRVGAGSRSPPAPPSQQQRRGRGGGLPGTWEPLGRAAGRGRFPPFGIPESSVPSGTGAVPHHPAQRPAASVAPLLGQASLSPRISMACGLPSCRVSQARRGAAPGAAPRLASRPSAVRAPKSGNYANTWDALCFDLNFLGMIPSHYGA